MVSSPLQSPLQSPLLAGIENDAEEEQIEVAKKRTEPIIINPKPRRVCLDPCFLLLWVLAWGAVGALSYFSFMRGNFYTILYPFDSLGNQCGVTPTVQNMPFLLLFNNTDPNGYKRCYPTCTNPNVDFIVCQYGVSAATNPTIREQQIRNKSCIEPIDTHSIHYRCVPRDLRPGNTTTLQLQWIEALVREVSERSYLSRFYNQIVYAWYRIAASVFSAFIFSIIWFSILLTAGHRVLHVSLFFVSLVSWAITGYLVYSVVQVKHLKTSIQFTASTGVALLDENIYSDTYLLVATGIFGFVSLAILAAIAVFRRHIALAGRLVQETAKAIQSIGVIPMLGSFQVLFTVLLTCFFVFLIGQILVASFPMYGFLTQVLHSTTPHCLSHILVLVEFFDALSAWTNRGICCCR
jgi:ABC-type multidrug transport system fused ATPase/permease subunit